MAISSTFLRASLALETAPEDDAVDEERDSNTAGGVGVAGSGSAKAAELAGGIAEEKWRGKAVTGCEAEEDREESEVGPESGAENKDEDETDDSLGEATSRHTVFGCTYTPDNAYGNTREGTRLRGADVNAIFPGRFCGEKEMEF